MSKVCVFFKLFSPWDIHNDSLAEFPPGSMLYVERQRGKKGDKQKEKYKEGQAHLALHHTWGGELDGVG